MAAPGADGAVGFNALGLDTNLYTRGGLNAPDERGGSMVRVCPSSGPQ
jgi:hypothetical protein